MMKKLIVVTSVIVSILVMLFPISQVGATYCDKGYHWVDIDDPTINFHGCVKDTPVPTPTAPPPTKICWDGSTIPVSEDCAPETKTCSDGSVVGKDEKCPELSKTNPTPAPKCESTCGPAVQARCENYLASDVSQIFDASGNEIHGWWTSLGEKSRVSIIFKSGLSDQMLKLILKDGEELHMEIVNGLSEVIYKSGTTEKISEVSGCRRHGHADGGGTNDLNYAVVSSVTVGKEGCTPDGQ